VLILVAMSNQHATTADEKSAKPAPVPTPDVLDLNQLAADLRVSTRTIARWVKLRADPLPAARPGGHRLIFLRANVYAWLARQRAKPRVRPLRSNRGKATA
jgi:hypothetical protein